jgi:hypothetical protein
MKKLTFFYFLIVLVITSIPVFAASPAITPVVVTGTVSVQGSVNLSAGTQATPIWVQDTARYITPTSDGSGDNVTITGSVAISAVPSDLRNAWLFPAVLTTWHKKQHDGKAFQAGKYFSDTDYHKIGIYVPAGVVMHLRLSANCADGALTLNAYKGGTFDGSGSTLTAKNINDTSATTAQVKFYLDPAISGSLTSLFDDDELIGTSTSSGAAPYQVGGGRVLEDSDSKILGPGQYIIIFNALAATVESKIRAEWYEQ